jgi:CubicO group peptidase (beta-lactamase class C family)
MRAVPLFLSPPHVHVYPVEEVTSQNSAAEVPPASVGLSRDAVERIWESVERLYKTGLHPAIALCVRHRGAIVLERAIGHTRGNAPGASRWEPKVAVRHDSLFNLFSAAKAVTAMVIHLLDERRLLHLDDRVAEYIPEYAKHGKTATTIRQILTHRAGIPTVREAHIELDLVTDWDRVLATLCDARPLSVPGHILEPLRFATFDYGMPPERVPEVAQNAFTGMPAVPPQSWLLKRALGVGVREATEMSNDPRYITSIIPSGNIVGTAEEACRFFELLRQEGQLDGVRVFEARTVRRAIAEQTYLEIDSFLGMPLRYGMGFMLGAKTFSPYGKDTANAYGHIGFTNVLAYADPDRELSVGLMTSGKPFITPGQITWLNVARTIARECPRVS